MIRPLVLACFVLLLNQGCQPAEKSMDRSKSINDAIDPLLADYPDATVAVFIDDPATNTQVSVNGDRLFHAASTMKIPVLIELYRRVKSGDVSLEDSVRVENRFRSIVDGSPFSIADDSDDEIYHRLGQQMSFRDLAYQMITVSSNLATNILIERLNADSVQATSERLGTENMQTLRGVEDLKAYDLGRNNRATARDLGTLLTALRDGKAVTETADSAMIDMLLDQHFNDMIPAGLPPDVRVAHKTGSITRIHHDAAIIYPPDSPAYVLVVMTEGIEEDSVSSVLGSLLSERVLGVLRGTPISAESK